METAPQLKASGLDGDYRILADFGGTVLAGTPSKYGVQFVTWDWDYGYVVETEHYRYCLRCNPSPGDYNCYCTAYDLDVQRQNMAQDKPLVGRVTYANGDAQEFTDAEAFLKCIRDELPYRPTTGFRYEVLTDDPSVRKQVDDMIFDFYGEEDPCRQEDHEPRPEQGMTFGGM